MANPAHIIYHGKDTSKTKGSKKIWTKIGAVWPTKSGKGSTITMEYHPTVPGITIMLPYDETKKPPDIQIIPDDYPA